MSRSWAVLCACPSTPSSGHPTEAEDPDRERAKPEDRPAEERPGNAGIGHGGGEELPSKVEMAKTVVLAIAERYPDRRIHVTADAAYISQALRKLPGRIRWTSRLRSNAALYGFPPPATGRRGRPRTKGDQPRPLAEIAENAVSTRVQVARYKADAATSPAVDVHSFTCLCYGVLGAETVKVVMVRDIGKSGYGIAIISTDLAAEDTELIERYARRWSIEVAFEEGKEIARVADARNRTRNAVQRTVPYCFYSMSILIIWYAAAEIDHDTILAHRRATAPWYTTKPIYRSPTFKPWPDASSPPQNFDPLMIPRPNLKKSRSPDWRWNQAPHKSESRVALAHVFYR